MNAQPEWVGFPDRRWGLEIQDDGTIRVFVFAGEYQRSRWLGNDPVRRWRRQAAGKRNPYVKAHRRHISGRANI